MERGSTFHECELSGQKDGFITFYQPSVMLFGSYEPWAYGFGQFPDRLVESSRIKKALEGVYTSILPKGSSPFIYLRFVLLLHWLEACVKKLTLLDEVY